MAPQETAISLCVLTTTVPILTMRKARVSQTSSVYLNTDGPDQPDLVSCIAIFIKVLLMSVRVLGIIMGSL